MALSADCIAVKYFEALLNLGEFKAVRNKAKLVLELLYFNLRRRPVWVVRV